VFLWPILSGSYGLLGLTLPWTGPGIPDFLWFCMLLLLFLFFSVLVDCSGEPVGSVGELVGY
jgi:hypothetical protein